MYTCDFFHTGSCPEWLIDDHDHKSAGLPKLTVLVAPTGNQLGGEYSAWMSCLNSHWSKSHYPQANHHARNL